MCQSSKCKKCVDKCRNGKQVYKRLVVSHHPWHTKHVEFLAISDLSTIRELTNTAASTVAVSCAVVNMIKMLRERLWTESCVLTEWVNFLLVQRRSKEKCTELESLVDGCEFTMSTSFDRTPQSGANLVRVCC